MKRSEKRTSSANNSTPLDTGAKVRPTPDGGYAFEELFDMVSESTPTRRDRLREHYLRFVHAPLAIMWYDWRAKTGAVLLFTYIFVGIVGPIVIEPTAPGQEAYARPWFESMENPLGTDEVGRDLLALTVYSTWPVLQMMAAGGLFTVLTGVVFGMISGYKGGSVDTILSTITDITINIPGLPLVMVLAIIFEPRNPYLIGILLTVAAWGGLARAIRSQVLTMRSESFTEASRVIGMSTGYIIIKDLLPRLMPYILVNFVFAARAVVFSAVALYFLGVLPITDPNWGVMLSQAHAAGALNRPAIYHWIIVPIIAIIGISMSLILLSQSMDRVFNPRVRARHLRSSKVGDEIEGADEAKSYDAMRQI